MTSPRDDMPARPAGAVAIAPLRWRRHLVALLAAVAAVAAALAVSQPTPVAAETGATITIVLDTTPSDGVDVGFTGCQGAGCAPFTLDDDSDGALPDRITATDLAPATYTVTQDAVPGWTLTAISCTNVSGSVVSTSVANRRATVTLTAAADITCTFTNQSPSVTIVQDTRPDDPRDFGYTGCLGSGCSTFTLDDDADPALPNTVTGGGLAPGTYTVTQRATSPWSLASIVCNSSTGITRDVPNQRVTIVLTGPTDHRTCTFTDVTQSLTIVDADLATTGQDHTYTGCSDDGCGAFTLDDDDGLDPTNGDRFASGPLPTGTYTIAQAAVPGHELTDLSCPNETVDLLAGRATVTLTAGENRTCTFTNRPTPIPLTGVAEISSGAFHTCARLANGEARCWGRIGAGGSIGAPSTKPVTIGAVEGPGPLTGVVDIAGNWSHNCAALQDGTAACWGSAESAIGDGTLHQETVLRPIRVLLPDGSGPLTGVTQVSAGPIRSCAVLDSGEARCWGRNDYGTLGDGTTTQSALPVVVRNEAGDGPLEDVTQIEVGLGQTCALLATSEVRCWGRREDGALGDGQAVAGNAPPALQPVTVVDPSGTAPLTGVSAISSAGRGTCALLFDGRGVCWGQVPTPLREPGTPWNRWVPHPVLDETGLVAAADLESIAAGMNSVCAVRTAGVAWCWGENGLGELGHGPQGSFEYLPLPVIDRPTVLPLGSVANISVGWDTACAALASGEGRCWGQNEGNIGDGTTLTRYWAEPVIAP